LPSVPKVTRKLLKSRRRPTMRKAETKAKGLRVKLTKQDLFETPEGLLSGPKRLALGASDNVHAFQRYLQWDELAELVIN
jgi:hypothetical protein